MCAYVPSVEARVQRAHGSGPKLERIEGTSSNNIFVCVYPRTVHI